MDAVKAPGGGTLPNARGVESELTQLFEPEHRVLSRRERCDRHIRGSLVEKREHAVTVQVGQVVVGGPRTLLCAVWVAVV